MLTHCCSVSAQGYGQWISLEIVNNNESDSGISIWITDIDLDYGKLYDGQNMDKGVNKDDIIGTEISPKNSHTVSSCGRKFSATGTEGTVTVSDRKQGGARIAGIYWDCPYSGDNRLEHRNKNNDWLVDVSSVKPDGPIREARATFSKD